MFKNKKIIVLFAVVFLIIIGAFWIILLDKGSQRILEETEGSIDLDKKIEEYAKENGYERFIRYEENWYANVDGKWIKAENREEAVVMNHASRTGYTKFTSVDGQLYVNLNGKWVKAENMEEAVYLYNQNRSL